MQKGDASENPRALDSRFSKQGLWFWKAFQKESYVLRICFKRDPIVFEGFFKGDPMNREGFSNGILLFRRLLKRKCLGSCRRLFKGEHMDMEQPL